MQVDGSLLGDECIHVRDADHDLHVAVRATVGDFDLVKVTRSVVVDRRPEQVSQIANVASRHNLRRLRFQIEKLLRHLRRKVRLESALLHDLFCDGLQVEVRRIGVVHELPVRK